MSMVTVNDIGLHYETAGEGEPLLWVHGFMGAGADWRYIFKQPPAGYRLIAPDLRGHGASTNPSGAFTFGQCGADLLALLDHLAIERVGAIGLSGGGIALLHLATAAPSRVRSLVLVSAPPYFPEQARAIQRMWSESMLSSSEMEMMRRRHTQGEAQLQQLFAQARTMADTGNDVDFTAPRLTAITAETLIVFGDRDPFYPVSLAVELHEAIPRSYLWVVPNAGHGPVFGSAAARFSETALSFLRGGWRAQSD